MMNWIGLLDCNNFFVSCERLFRPDLAKKPVVVLSSNDGCVVARSQEVKDMGIPMGIPHFKVKKEFEQAGVVVFSSNFTLYRDISARVMRVLQQEVEEMEQYSVDEAFFTLTESQVQIEELVRIKQVVEQKVGVPVSVGLAKTKTLAKVANHTAKKDSGAYILTNDAWNKEAGEVPISTIWGVGRGMSARFATENIVTPRDLMQADSARIADVYGVVGTRLRSELLGVSATTLDRKLDLQHSIMSTRSFGEVTSNLPDLERALAHHIEHSTAELRAMGGLTNSMRILVRPSRFSDFAFQGINAEVQLDEPTDDTRVFLREGMKALRSQHRASVPYKKAGVVFLNIVSKEMQTTSLFGTKMDSSLMSVVDAINKRFGPDGVTFFGNGKQGALTKSGWHSGNKTTRWIDIPTVKAS